MIQANIAMRQAEGIIRLLALSILTNVLLFSINTVDTAASQSSSSQQGSKSYISNVNTNSSTDITRDRDQGKIIVR